MSSNNLSSSRYNWCNWQRRSTGSFTFTEDIPQISPRATTAQLGNRTTYPNFFRILPEETKQIMVKSF